MAFSVWFGSEQGSYTEASDSKEVVVSDWFVGTVIVVLELKSNHTYDTPPPNLGRRRDPRSHASGRSSRMKEVNQWSGVLANMANNRLRSDPPDVVSPSTSRPYPSDPHNPKGTAPLRERKRESENRNASDWPIKLLSAKAKM